MCAAAANIPLLLAREAVARVADHHGYPPENALLRILRMAKVRPVRVYRQTAEGWSGGWSLVSVWGEYATIDLDNDWWHLDDTTAAGLLPASGKPEGPVERPQWPTVEAAAYLIKAAPIELADWTPEMGREKEQAEIDLGEATAAGVPTWGRKGPGLPLERIPPSDASPDMVRLKGVPPNPSHRPKVVFHIDGTIGISLPLRGDYKGPSWCSAVYDSAALRLWREGRSEPPQSAQVEPKKAEQQKLVLLPDEPQFEPKIWRPEDVQLWFKEAKDNHPRESDENKSAYARRLHNDHMRNDFVGGAIPWTLATLRRRLDDDD
jgi:hypothetical protein